MCVCVWLCPLARRVCVRVCGREVWVGVERREGLLGGGGGLVGLLGAGGRVGGIWRLFAWGEWGEEQREGVCLHEPFWLAGRVLSSMSCSRAFTPSILRYLPCLCVRSTTCPAHPPTHPPTPTPAPSGGGDSTAQDAEQAKNLTQRPLLSAPF